jgi:hypothetical protein
MIKKRRMTHINRRRRKKKMQVKISDVASFYAIVDVHNNYVPYDFQIQREVMENHMNMNDMYSFFRRKKKV